MTAERPIVLDEDEDDIQMDDQDELAPSSNKDRRHFVPTGKKLFTSSSKVAKAGPASNPLHVDEYRRTEEMMSPAKLWKSPKKLPIEDPMSPSDEELFTKNARLQRLQSEEGRSPQSTPLSVSNWKAASTVGRTDDNAETPTGLQGVWYSSPKTVDQQAESPDILQVDKEQLQNTTGRKQMPLHQASGSTIANLINGGGKHSSKLEVHSPSIEEAEQEHPRTLRSIHEAPRPRLLPPSRKPKYPKNCFPLRRFRHASLPEDFAYFVRLEKSDETLRLFPQDGSILDDDPIFTMPLTRVRKIYQGQGNCTLVMFALTRTTGTSNDVKMFLELESEKQVCNFVILVQQLAHGEPGIVPHEA